MIRFGNGRREYILVVELGLRRKTSEEGSEGAVGELEQTARDGVKEVAVTDSEEAGDALIFLSAGLVETTCIFLCVGLPCYDCFI